MHAVPAVEQSLTEELRPPLTVREALVEADRCLACGGPARRPRSAPEGQVRIAHLLRPENRPLVERIQAQVDAERAELEARGGAG